MTVELLPRPIGNGSRVEVTLKVDGTVIDADVLNLASAKARSTFISRIAPKVPGLSAMDLSKQLLLLHEQLQTMPLEAAPTALHVSSIARSELFHTTDVSGVAVPTIRTSAGKMVGQWELYTRWHADGRRERRDLEQSLTLPDGGRLWFHPVPGEPEPTMRPGWSSQSRTFWIDGDPAPDAADVFRRVCERIAYYVDFQPETAQGTTATLALWVLLTYVYPVWPSVCYLAVGGPMESGKSTLFHVLARMVHRPLEASNLTAPCLFRTLHERGGVLLMDEAERLREGTPEAGELRSILLSGYKRGSPARRLEKVGDSFRQVAFEVFGPKAIAGIAALPEALASRCIRIIMFRSAADSPKPRRRLDDDPKRWSDLRDCLHILTLEHGQTWLKLARCSDVVPANFSGRDYELWQPLLALAAWLESTGLDGLLDVVQRYAEEAVEVNREDAVPETDETLVKLLTEAVLDGVQDRTKARDLLKRAQEIDATAFAKWSAKGVANALGRYGLRTHKGTGSTGRTYRRITVADLRRVQAAYGFDLVLPGENVPHVPRRAATSIFDAEN